LRAKRSDLMEDGLLTEGELRDGLKNARQDGLTEAEKKAKKRKALYNSDKFEGDIGLMFYGFNKKNISSKPRIFKESS
jgi:hypothetical protein